MGAGASSGRPGPAPPRPVVSSTVARPEFPVSPLSVPLELPKALTLRIDPEALRLLDSATRAIVVAYPYHRILCWGSSDDSFQFRNYANVTDVLDTVILATHDGRRIEAVLMKAVTDLMTAMQCRGISETEFEQTKAALGEEADRCVEVVKQMAITRQFDVKQAVVIVQMMDALSPFDKVEMAVTLYSCLINKDSFPLVLEQFPAKEDKENICHRLGILIDPEGNLTKRPK